MSDKVTLPSPEQPSRKPRLWLTILLVTIGLCLLLVITFIGGMTVLGRQVEATYLVLTCTEQNPGLSREGCEAWVEDLKANYRPEMRECSRIAGSDTDLETDEYKCLVERGLGPGD